MSEQCLAGQGDECHTPGCAFWMCSVPSDDVANVLLTTAVPRASPMSEQIGEPCADCGATAGAPCDVRVNGQPMAGWVHDSRILAPVLREISRRALNA